MAGHQPAGEEGHHAHREGERQGLPELAVARELEEGELVELRLAEPTRPVSIVAQWHPRLGLAERPLRTLLDLARRADPLPEASRPAEAS
ncbi:hypothetical protein GCM10010319_69430 [Streptomyces blastmyceticus]|uniref:Uncharacterized protein n=1 Tax=Streptomyces blastmyceticus TaxID=68180 RepID=A0ABN0Y2M9_9ACTN